MAVTINASTSAGLVQTADTSGVLQLQTNSGTTALTIDTSQNVGIGTTSPAAIASGHTVVDISAASGKSANIYLHGNGTSGNSAGLQIQSSTGDCGLYQLDNAPMVFATNNANRMRITAGGNVVIGDTAAPAGAGNTSFYVKQPSADYSAYFRSSNATAANCYGPFIQYSAAAPNGTGNEFFAAVDSAVTRMTVRSNGGIANYSGNNVNLSDQREKTNIELAGSYLDKVCAIPVKTFNYIDQNMEEDGGLTLGVIAQDVQAVAPELVMESNWASKDEPEKLRLSIYQTDLQYALMKCIQEQQTIINDLKARITALEAK
jgi:hypothetical protein